MNKIVSIHGYAISNTFSLPIIQLTSIFGSLPGFIAVNVIGFSPGSVVVSYEILLDPSSIVTGSDATQLLQQTGNTGLFIISLMDDDQGIFNPFSAWQKGGQG